MTNIYFRLLLFLIIPVMLLSIPMIITIHFLPLYFVGVFLLSIYSFFRMILFYDQFEKRKYIFWKKRKENGIFKNVIFESIKSGVLTALVLIITFLFAYGRTPLDVISKLEIKEKIFSFSFFILFSFLLGVITVYEKSRKFQD